MATNPVSPGGIGILVLLVLMFGLIFGFVIGANSAPSQRVKATPPTVADRR